MCVRQAKRIGSLVWWLTPVFSTLRRLGQED